MLQVINGVLSGRQPNGMYIIGIDFDCYGKNGDNVIHHEDAKEWFDEFTETFSKDGIWESGTKEQLWTYV